VGGRLFEIEPLLSMSLFMPNISTPAWQVRMTHRAWFLSTPLRGLRASDPRCLARFLLELDGILSVTDKYGRG
jgi:hypothetical protein